MHNFGTGINNLHMKKTLIILLAAALTGFAAAGQNAVKHLEFMGIPLDGSKEAFFEKLAEKGFTRTQDWLFGGYEDEARGDYAGFSRCKVEVYSVPGMDVVYSVKLTIPESDAPGFEERIERFYSLLQRSFPREEGYIEVDEDDDTVVTFYDAENTRLLEAKMYEDLGISREDYERESLERAVEVKEELQCGAEEVEEEEIVQEAIPFQLVEQKPMFRGGDANTFSKWVNERLVYPEDAKANAVQGMVMIQFTVEADGSVTNVRVLRGVDSSIDAEAVRVVSSSPKWTPGRQRDRAVRVTYTFPVIFQLRNQGKVEEKK